MTMLAEPAVLTSAPKMNIIVGMSSSPAATPMPKRETSGKMNHDTMRNDLRRLERENDFDED
jgi:hypothetical protein